jgi:hypothetical protein
MPSRLDGSEVQAIPFASKDDAAGGMRSLPPLARL